MKLRVSSPCCCSGLGRSGSIHSAIWESDCPKDKPWARLYQLLAAVYLDFLVASHRAVGEDWAVLDLSV